MQAFRDLTRPTPLIAASVLALNDHVLKGSGVVPGAITGKLSDLAGLFVAPILAVALARALGQRVTGELPRRDGRLAAAVVVAVALGFALLKSWPAFHAAVNTVWGPHVLDPSDLWCLPAVLLAWIWLVDREREAHAASRFGSALALAGTLIVCAATPRAPPVPPPPVPAWSIAAKPLDLPCGTADVWVAKSGKTGLGVTIRLVPKPEQACRPTIAATLKFADRAFAGRLVEARPPTEASARRHAPPTPPNAAYYYLAFELDNEARWNRGDRTATFELAIDGRTHALPATHAYVEFPVKDR